MKTYAEPVMEITKYNIADILLATGGPSVPDPFGDIDPIAPGGEWEWQRALMGTNIYANVCSMLL